VPDRESRPVIAELCGPGGMSPARTAVRAGDLVYSMLPLPGSPETMGKLLARNAARFGIRAMFQEKRAGRCHSVSWSEFLLEVAAFARFLDSAGVVAGDRVALYSSNRGEMLVAEFATMALGAIYVPIFPGYPAEQAMALAEHASPTVLIVVDADQLEKVRVPRSVRALVSFEPIPAAAVEGVLEDRQVSYTPFQAVLRGFAVGNRDPWLAHFLESAAGWDPLAPCLMLYTSGTTGLNKGVLLSHENLLSQQRALSRIRSITPSDRFLSYLPWHHSFGGNFEKYAALYHGALLVLDDSQGKDFELLIRNWKEVRPTVYFSVPKVFQQLVSHAETHPEDAERIFHRELRFVFTAAAPLPANLSAFFAARGIPVQEGWGLTETSPCCTVTDPAEPRAVPGMVGYPIPGVTLKLAPDEEILVQGPNVMCGYFASPEATAAVLPGDGWFHTGDLGQFVGAGLRLVTRKDRVFKMLNAEKVVPTELENRLAGMNPYIRHVIVAGEGRNFLAALIFPDFFRIEQEFGSDRGLADRLVKQSLRATILEFNAGHLVKYERIQAFAIVSRELSVENQELTPSLKIRFRNVLRNTEEYLDAVYQPSQECDCRFLRKVMRLAPDERLCFAGRSRTLDRCHECGNFVFGD
jgi:long-subunit acyl-CoA synthetase (AMP-forming)